MAKRHREAAAKAQEFEDRQRALAAAQQRRPSRFEVVPVISEQNLESKSTDSLDAQITVHSQGGVSNEITVLLVQYDFVLFLDKYFLPL